MGIHTPIRVLLEPKSFDHELFEKGAPACSGCIEKGRLELGESVNSVETDLAWDLIARRIV